MAALLKLRKIRVRLYFGAGHVSRNFETKCQYSLKTNCYATVVLERTATIRDPRQRFGTGQSDFTGEFETNENHLPTDTSRIMALLLKTFGKFVPCGSSVPWSSRIELSSLKTLSLNNLAWSRQLSVLDNAVYFYIKKMSFYDITFVYQQLVLFYQLLKIQ